MSGAARHCNALKAERPRYYSFSRQGPLDPVTSRFPGRGRWTLSLLVFPAGATGPCHFSFSRQGPLDPVTSRFHDFTKFPVIQIYPNTVLKIRSEMQEQKIRRKNKKFKIQIGLFI
jgi:hypothetical protein